MLVGRFNPDVVHQGRMAHTRDIDRVETPLFRQVAATAAGRLGNLVVAEKWNACKHDGNR